MENSDQNSYNILEPNSLQNSRSHWRLNSSHQKKSSSTTTNVAFVPDTKTSFHLTAPMHGILSKIFVEKNDSVPIGDTLITLEAMKMEHAIKAPFSGIFSTLYYTTGDTIEMGSELLVLGPQ